MTTPTECSCDRHDKGPHSYHSKGCPMHDHPDSLKEKITRMEAVILHHERIATRSITASRLWEGKFHAVKRENNALRKKLYGGKKP